VHVFPEGGVRGAQGAHVARHARVERAAAGGSSQDRGVLGRELACALLEPLEIQQLGAKRAGRDGLDTAP
jgi:hypothetical protein